MGKRVGNVGAELVEAAELPVPGFDAGALDAAGMKAAAKAPVEQLLALANDGRDGVRRNAWRAIGSQGKLDQYTTMRAAVALRDEDDEVKTLAAQALRGADASESVRVIDGLVRARLDPAHAVREAVIATLDALGERFVERMPDILDARDDRIAGAIVDTCEELGAKRVGAAIRAALTHIGPVHRHTALLALHRLGDAELDKAWKHLVEGLRDPYDPARAAFVTAIGLLPAKAAGDAALVARLTEMYEDDGNWMVRDAAHRALKKIAAA